MSKVVGIDMGGTSIKIGLVEEGKILTASKIRTHSHSLKAYLGELEKMINSLLRDPDSSLTGIGVAFPSIVDSDRMKILSRYVKYTDAHEIDLAGWARERFGVPLIIENDARAALVGEWRYGAGRNCNDLVLLTFGTGVGSAVLLEGRLLKGKHFFGGNLGGHTIIKWDGEKCNCGGIGCVETEGSTWALSRKAQEMSGYKASSFFNNIDGINFESIFKNASAGDGFAIKVRDHSLKIWGLCVVNLIHAYDPERVIIGGGIMKSKDIILPVVKNMVDTYSWCKTADIDILAAEQVEYAGILGMAYLVEDFKKINNEIKF